MNADQKERLLKLAETDPVLAHKVADFMNAGNAENSNTTASQEKMESTDTEASDTKNLTWYDALLAKGILDNSVSSLGTVVLNNDNSGAGNNSGQNEKLKVTKEQLWWARSGVFLVIFMAVVAVVCFTNLLIKNNEEALRFCVTTCLTVGFFCAIGVQICKMKSNIPSIKTFLSKNFTVQ